MNVIDREGRAEIEIRKSRFLARTLRAAAPDAALALLRGVRDENKDARHHCWAWRIGPAAEQARYSDDGEPSGTAGPPILNVLARRDLTNVLLVVTRWFGGIKLGAGGLARAYGQAAKAAVDASAPRALRRLVTYRIELPHAALPPFEHYLAGQGFEVTDRAFDEAAGLTVRIPEESEAEFLSRYNALVGGRRPCRELGRELA